MRSYSRNGFFEQSLSEKARLAYKAGQVASGGRRQHVIVNIQDLGASPFYFSPITRIKWKNSNSFPIAKGEHGKTVKYYFVRKTALKKLQIMGSSPPLPSPLANFPQQICLYVFPSFRLSVFLSFCLSVFLSFCLFTFLPFCLSVFLSTSGQLPTKPPWLSQAATSVAVGEPLPPPSLHHLLLLNLGGAK